MLKNNVFIEKKNKIKYNIFHIQKLTEIEIFLKYGFFWGNIKKFVK